MNSALAGAFRKMIAAKMGQGVKGLNTVSSLVDGDDRLRARLAAWERAVEEARGYRGNEEGEIWNLEAAREAEKAAKQEAKKQKDLAKLEKDNKITFTIQELYKRIMRVERLSEIVEARGIDVGKTLESRGLTNLILNKKKPSEA